MTTTTEITTHELTFDEMNAVSGGNGWNTVNGVLAGISSTFNVGESAVMAGSFLMAAGAITVARQERSEKQEKQ